MIIRANLRPSVMQGAQHMTYGEILFRTGTSFVALLVLTRLLGKKQVGHLTFFNYVTGITFGSTTAEIIVNRQITLLQGVSSLILWSFLAFIVAWIGLRSVRAREILDGQHSFFRSSILRRAPIGRDAVYRQIPGFDSIKRPEATT